MASSMTDTMTVRAIDRSGWGTSAPYPTIRTVEISAHCPVCGQLRGEPRHHRFHEDGEWLSCDVWENPCGHEDMYEAVLSEARDRQRRATVLETQTPSR
jgi:predicted nucleic acid-binding Zn ribbon protein